MKRDEQEELELTANYADRLKIQLDASLRANAEQVGKLCQRIAMLETMTKMTADEAQERFNRICKKFEEDLYVSTDREGNPLGED